MLKHSSAYCYKLNETAGFLWEHLSKPRSLEDLIKLMVKNYDVDESVAERDVETFLKHGTKHGFLSSNPSR